jgi:hypothetical protein
MDSFPDAAPPPARSVATNRAPGGEGRAVQQVNTSQQDRQHGGEEQPPAYESLPQQCSPPYHLNALPTTLETQHHQEATARAATWREPPLYQPPPPYQYYPPTPARFITPAVYSAGVFDRTIGPSHPNNGVLGTASHSNSNATRHGPAQEGYSRLNSRPMPNSHQPQINMFENHADSVNPWTLLEVNGFRAGSISSLPQGGGKRGGGWAPRGRQEQDIHENAFRHESAQNDVGGRGRGRGPNAGRQLRDAHRGRSYGPSRLLNPPRATFPYEDSYQGQVSSSTPQRPQFAGYVHSSGFAPPLTGVPGTSSGILPPASVPYGPPHILYTGFRPHNGYPPATQYGNGYYPQPGIQFPPAPNAYSPSHHIRPAQPYPYCPTGPRIDPGCQFAQGYHPQTGPVHGHKVSSSYVPPTHPPTYAHPPPNYPVPVPRFVSGTRARTHPRSGQPLLSVKKSTPGQPLRWISTPVRHQFVPSGGNTGVDEVQTQGGAMKEGKNEASEQDAEGNDDGDGVGLEGK